MLLRILSKKSLYLEVTNNNMLFCYCCTVQRKIIQKYKLLILNNNYLFSARDVSHMFSLLGTINQTISALVIVNLKTTVIRFQLSVIAVIAGAIKSGQYLFSS